MNTKHFRQADGDPSEQTENVDKTKIKKIGLKTLSFKLIGQAKNKSKLAISPLFYTAAYYLLRVVFAIFFRFTCERKFDSQKLQGPSIIIAPHLSLIHI